MNAPPRVLLDACVLYPPVLRGVLMNCAAAGLFVPLWSPRILAEWAHAAGRSGAESAAAAAVAIGRLRAAFPDAEVLPAETTEAGLALPDPADAHVLAAALDGRADVLLTLNLRDFPRRVMAAHGLVAEAPDTLLMRLWVVRPEVVAGAASGVAGRAAMKRAGLPRLGKALAQEEG